LKAGDKAILTLTDKAGKAAQGRFEAKWRAISGALAARENDVESRQPGRRCEEAIGSANTKTSCWRSGGAFVAGYGW